MFSLPWRKREPATKVEEPPETVKLDWLDKFMPVDAKLPRPNWETINDFVAKNHNDLDQHELWCNIARNWVDLLAEHLPGEYTKIETDNFILLSSGETWYGTNLSNYLERCRKRLLAIAKGVCADDGFGKHVVIVFSDIDSYYDYVSYYGPQEGTYGLSAGMYLNYGYGHFVFRNEDLDTAEMISAHELTHALLAHLPIPLWLNEGMAVNMESMITGVSPEMLNNTRMELHQAFWNSETIQEFWHGGSFFRPDDGQLLSYQLAQILVTTLSKNYSTFTKFANAAHWTNSGESALDEAYGLSLGDLVGNFLGPGDWHPKPCMWSSIDNIDS